MYGRYAARVVTMNAVRLGVGVIGLGVGAHHARAFEAHPGCFIAALCDLDATRLAEVARLYPQARSYSSADDLILDPAVHIVSIASHDDHHGRQVVYALRAGKHVFAEKPLCLSRPELREIVRAWREARGLLRLTTNTVLRRSPRFRWLKDAILAGRLGTVFCIEGDYVYGRLPKLTSGWRGAIPGYSVMLGGGIHIIDLTLWMSAARPVEVMAYGSTLGSSHTAFHGIDLVLALLRFENGLIAKIGANFASVYPHFHRFVVHGTEATFENLPSDVSSSARLWQERDGGLPPLLVEAAYPAVGKGDLVPAFVEAVSGCGAPDVTEDEVFASVATCLAIQQSLARGVAVPVEYE
jgi:predicted dehydrogenase